MKQMNTTNDAATSITRTIHAIGHDPESGIWFFGDCAFLPGKSLLESKGKNDIVIFPDGNFVFRHDGVEYRMDTDECYAHGIPRFFAHTNGPECLDTLCEGGLSAAMTEGGDTGRIFMRLAADLVESLDGPDGLLLLGSALAHFIAPELLERYHAQPGTWLFGKAGGGKSTIARALMALWGFKPEYRDVSLSIGLTACGMERILGQYSNVPVHFEDAGAAMVSKDQVHILRSAYNRTGRTNGTPGGGGTVTVRPATSPIVVGETASNDAATMSRFVTVKIKASRIGGKAAQLERFYRMQIGNHYNYRIGRWLLLNRPLVAAKLMCEIDVLMTSMAQDARFSQLPERSRFVYGTAMSVVVFLMGHFEAMTWEKHGLKAEDKARLDAAIANLPRHVEAILRLSAMVRN